jgi:hypothetical protein
MIEGFVRNAAAHVARDPRFAGLLAAGSLATGDADRFSDIDFVVVVRAEDYGAVMADRTAVAAALGELASCFTGEHVGEPRLLICLYLVPEGDGVLHVDLKFVTPDDLAHRVDEPLVLHDVDGVCAAVLERTKAHWPERDPQWFEDRAWIWLHYGAARLARGERYECLAMLGYFREMVLGPMLARRAGAAQRGLRRIEARAPDHAPALTSTVADATAASLWSALSATAALYGDLCGDAPPEMPRASAKRAVLSYIARLREEMS